MGGKGEEQTVDCGLRFRKADGELSPVFGGVFIGPRPSTRPVGVCICHQMPVLVVYGLFRHVNATVYLL